MKTGISLAALAAFSIVPLASAQTVFVDDNFDSYADQSALEAAWRPDAGDGQSPAGTVGILLPTADTGTFPEPNNSPPDLMGGAIGGITAGGVNESTASFDAAPSMTENVVVRGDIWTDGVTGNWRHSIGLRNDTIDRDPGTFGNQFGLNLIEMGFYNADSCDPTVEGCIPGDSQDPTAEGFRPTTGFATRTVLFQFGSLGNAFENGVETGPLLTTPNYQYFQLDPALDLPTSILPNGATGNEDGQVDLADIGEGWHTFQATISETSILYELDLFRDGVNNVTNSAGFDASLEYEIALSEDPSNAGVAAGFTSLRVGGISGITGNAVLAYDNLYLATEPASADPDPLAGDANGDGTVNLLDLDILGGNFGTASGATFADGDFDGNGTIDQADLDLLSANYGLSLEATGVAVPEPTAIVMLFSLTAGCVASRRS